MCVHLHVLACMCESVCVHVLVCVLSVAQESGLLATG